MLRLVVNGKPDFRGRLMSTSAFFVFFAFVIVGFIFVSTDKEYNLNQQIARGYITRDAIFFEIHDPSRMTYKAGSFGVDPETGEMIIYGNADVSIDENGGISLDLDPDEAEDPTYVFGNNIDATGLTQIESLLLSGGDNYLAAAHDGNMRGIVYKGNVVEPPIIEGRFFKEDECVSREKLAVIGSDYIELCYEMNGLRYIDYNNDTYEVIGITGIASPSAMDHLILINLGGISPETQNRGRFYIDGEGSMESVYTKLESSSLDIFGQPLDRLETPTTLIDSASGGMYLKPYLKVLLFLLYLFIYMSLMIQILKRQKVKIAVMSIYGMSFLRRFLAVAGSVMIWSIIGTLSGCVIDMILVRIHFFVLPYDMLKHDILTLLSISGLMIIVLGLAISFGIRKINVGEVIREA